MSKEKVQKMEDEQEMKKDMGMAEGDMQETKDHMQKAEDDMRQAKQRAGKQMGKPKEQLKGQQAEKMEGKQAEKTKEHPATEEDNRKEKGKEGAERVRMHDILYAEAGIASVKMMVPVTHIDRRRVIVRRVEEKKELERLIDHFGDFLTPVLRERMTNTKRLSRKLFTSGVTFVMEAEVPVMETAASGAEKGVSAVKAETPEDGRWRKEKRPVGIISGYLNGKYGDYGWISLVVIDPYCRRMHAGTMLIDAFEEEARERNVQRLFLEAAGTNSGAQIFYLKNGFYAVTRDLASFFPVRSRRDAVLMTKGIYTLENVKRNKETG